MYIIHTQRHARACTSRYAMTAGSGDGGDNRFWRDGGGGSDGDARARRRSHRRRRRRHRRYNSSLLLPFFHSENVLPAPPPTLFRFRKLTNYNVSPPDARPHSPLSRRVVDRVERWRAAASGRDEAD